jgi:predicted nucleic-acid-binding protein
VYSSCLVCFADVLLQKDAVQSLNRQLALQTLRQNGSGFASEVLEQPPVALTAGKTLSPEERETVVKTLDGFLNSKQYEQYRETIMQLYSDGLVSWGELQECWGAAQAAQELTAAAEGPVGIAGE